MSGGATVHTVDGVLQARAATSDDAAGIAAIYAPVVATTAISFEEVPPAAEEIARRMMAGPRLPWLVADRDAEVVGYAYASPHRVRPGYRWSVDVSIYLATAERGRGTARLLYEALLAEVQKLGYVHAYAGIALPNAASVGLHEAMGFAPVGVYRQVGFKQGRWHDVGWWQYSLGPLPPQPSEPTEWAPPVR